MTPTEITPLVVPNNTNARTGRSNLTLGFGLGIIFAGLLIVSYFLGTVSNSYSVRYHDRSSTAATSSLIQHDENNQDEEDNPPKYIATQFISFTINTIGGLADHGECVGRSVDPKSGVCYLGNTRNITQDVHHRLEIVKQVLSRIKKDAFRESPDIDHVDNVLKIVSLPEFFWRGPNGAYTTTELSVLFSQVQDELHAMIEDEFFNDFLFCFGTIIAARSIDDPTIQTPNSSSSWQQDDPVSAKQLEYFNLAPIAKGGPNQQAYIVTKKYISGADFLSRTTLPNPTEENVRDYAHLNKELQALFDSRNVSVIQDNLLELADGLRIGIEICLDHRLGVLWNHLRTKHNSELVDVLLVTSAGMAIDRGPNPVVPGGVVYLSDGEASSAACMRTTDEQTFHPNLVCRGESSIGGLKHIPIGGAGYSSFFGLTACWDLEDIDLLKGYYSIFQTQGCAFTLKTYDIDVMDKFKYYPPSIEIYPTVDLPKK